jgi:hypothetical protein
VAVPGGGRRGEVGFTCIRAEPENPAIRLRIDPPLADQHAIPITVKTVVAGDRVAVGLQDILAPSERGNQSQERGFRQVEVCEQLVHHAEVVAGEEEDFRLGTTGCDHIPFSSDGGTGRCIFQSTNHSCSYGEDRAGFGFCLLNFAGHFGSDFVGFGVDFVLFERFGVDGLECAEADVESYFAEFATFGFEYVENFRCEMEASRGGGHCARAPGVDGLVALAIGCFVGTIDVGRKRDVPETLQVFLDGKRIMRREADRANSQFAARKNLTFEFTSSKLYSLAYLHFLARADQGFPNIAFEFSGEKYFHVSGQVFADCFTRGLLRVNAEAFAEEPGGNYACVVEDDQLLTSEEVGKPREVRVLELTARALDDEQARGVPAVQRALGDQFGRKVVVEVIHAHGIQL